MVEEGQALVKNMCYFPATETPPKPKNSHSAPQNLLQDNEELSVIFQAHLITFQEFYKQKRPSSGCRCFSAPKFPTLITLNL
ncbi:hypothetical protein PSTT_08726, partial [Puccinia striiformis]